MAHTTHRARRARPILAVPAAVVSVGLAAAALTATPGAASAAGPPAPRAEITAEAPVYAVTGQGMSQDEAQALAERLGIAPALEKSGAFSYVDAARYGKVPSRKGVTGTDERGRRTVARRLDVDALKALDVMPEGEATERARGILRLPKGFDAEPQVSHTQLTMADAAGRDARSVRPRHHRRLRLHPRRPPGRGHRATATASPSPRTAPSWHSPSRSATCSRRASSASSVPTRRASSATGCTEARSTSSSRSSSTARPR